VTLTAVVTALVVGGGAAAAWLLLGTEKVLDQAKVQDEVQRILVDEFNLPVDDGSVTCPAKMLAAPPNKYVCDYNEGQGQAQVTVINEGEYLVGIVGEGESEELVDPLVVTEGDDGYGWRGLETEAPSDEDTPEE
jgi:hypothetical protein